MQLYRAKATDADNMILARRAIICNYLAYVAVKLQEPMLGRGECNEGRAFVFTNTEHFPDNISQQPMHDIQFCEVEQVFDAI